MAGSAVARVLGMEDVAIEILKYLPVEQVRDGLLAVSGELDLESGGEGVASAGSNRRSVYRRVMRNSPDEVMQTFDSPDHISHMPPECLLIP